MYHVISEFLDMVMMLSVYVPCDFRIYGHGHDADCVYTYVFRVYGHGHDAECTNASDGDA